MNTLQLAWHQAKKDILPPLADAPPLADHTHRVCGSFVLGIRTKWGLGAVRAVGKFIVHGYRSLITAFLTFITINTDTPYNSSATYLTRPVGWKAVAAGKLLVVCIFFVVLPAAGRLCGRLCTWGAFSTVVSFRFSTCGASFHSSVRPSSRCSFTRTYRCDQQRRNRGVAVGPWSIHHLEALRRRHRE